MALNEAVLARLVRLLSPLVIEVSERRALVTLAFGTTNQELLTSIEYEGAAQVFVVNLVSRLDALGGIGDKDGKPLVNLLDAAKLQYGIDKDAVFDELFGVLTAPNVDTASEALSPLETPFTTKSKQKHVFVSYSRNNTEAMKRLRADLKAANIEVWTDESIEVGEPAWFVAVGKAIEEAYCVVVILSPEAKNSEWVGKEIEYALNIHKRPVFPVLYEGNQQNSLPFLLAGTQWVDIHRDYSGGLRKLVAAIRGIKPLEPTDLTPPPPPRLLIDDCRPNDTTWKQVIDRIHAGLCTIFIGPELNDQLMLPQRDLARSWANSHNYPFPQTDDLAMITHFLGLTGDDPSYIKEKLLEEWFANTDTHSAIPPNTAYDILASLPIHLYVASTYDDFMYTALEAHKKEPTKLIYDDPPNNWTGKEFNEQHPLVYHLYGHRDNAPSAILMEDDYLNYLTDFSRGDRAFPDWLQRRIANTILMFVGFNITHWNFRILFRILSRLRYNRAPHVAVQVPMSSRQDTEEQRQLVCKYLKNYYMQMKTHVYVGSTDEFLAELSQRMGRNS